MSRRSIEPIDAIQAAVDIELSTVQPPTKTDDPFLVAFDEPYDADNPKCWSSAKKWTVTDIMSATGFNRIMLSTIMAPALPAIMRDLDMTHFQAVMALSCYMLATAFGPLLLGPLSELYGRTPVLHASNVWFFVFNLVCGFANTKGTLIAARVLAGLGASAIYSLSGGVLSDIWTPAQRGKSLSIYLLIPLLGAAVGPIIGAVIAERSSWRWMFWSTSAFQAVMVVISFPTFHETYAPLILRRRAAKLRRETGDHRYVTEGERRGGTMSVRRVVVRGLSRPLRLLATHPVIQVTALLNGVEYGVLYIVLSTFSEVWTTQYHTSTEVSGLHYLAIAFGEIVGSQVGGPAMDFIFKRLTRRHNTTTPEFHIPLLVPGSILAAVGLVLYGWAVHFRLHWAIVDLGIFIAGLGGQISTMPLSAYVIDSYPVYASSATAASQLVRSLTAFGFPLLAGSVYRALGWGWGNVLLAGLYLVVGGPAAVGIWMYGKNLREKRGENAEM